jgi:hypothetical protein
MFCILHMVHASAGDLAAFMSAEGGVERGVFALP